MTRVTTRAKGDGLDVVLVSLAALLLLTQAVHAAEHVVQFGYWISHPLEQPFLTPLAVAGRDALAPTAGGSPAGGAELLHLLGNLLFLAGLGLLTGHLRHVRRRRPTALTAAIGAQGIHVAEHLVLTTTWALTGTAVGASTLFGAVEGSTASGLRVILHLALNIVPTALTAVALWQLWRHGRRRPTTSTTPSWSV